MLFFAVQTLTNTETATATYYSTEVVPTTVTVVGDAKYPTCAGSPGNSGWARYDGYTFVDTAASVSLLLRDVKFGRYS